jgi:hypothetical protein
MRTIGTKVIIEASLNGKKANFLVDTGADISVIDKNQLKRFGIRYTDSSNPRGHAVGFNGSTEKIIQLRNVDLQLGEIFTHNHVFALDLSGIVNFINQKTNVKIAGIIGADILMKYKTIIDYDQKSLILSSYKKKHLALK